MHLARAEHRVLAQHAGPADLVYDGATFIVTDEPMSRDKLDRSGRRRVAKGDLVAEEELRVLGEGVLPYGLRLDGNLSKDHDLRGNATFT